MTNQEKQTEEKIFTAAVDEFEEKGLTGARMQQIADRAGINKAMLHYYYRSKEKLFSAVFEKLAAIMFKKIFSCFDNDLPLAEKLELFYQEHISFLQKNPKMPGFILNEINQNPERVANIVQAVGIQKIQNSFISQIKKEIDDEKIVEIDEMQLVVNILALSVFPFAARGLLENILKAQNIDWDEFIQERKTLCPQFIMNAVEKK